MPKLSLAIFKSLILQKCRKPKENLELEKFQLKDNPEHNPINHHGPKTNASTYNSLTNS